MFRALVSRSVRLVILLALGGCIQSSRDIAKDGLLPELPLLPGNYKEDANHTAKVTRNGDGYTIREITRRIAESGKVKIAESTHSVRLFKIPEFDGYIVQENVDN